MYQEITDSSTGFASLFNAIVAPRPIGWISTISSAGMVNLAPFSYFNAISPAPAMVMFCCNGPTPGRDRKDTVSNLHDVPEFVANFVSWDLREAMNATSATVSAETNEFELAGLEHAPSKIVRPPRVLAAPAHLECRVVRIVELPPQGPRDVMSNLVIGKVVAVHVQDQFLNAQGRFDTLKARPLVRLGGFNYATLGEVFEMARPAEQH
jgi:flavin reductase (DIM6/NTAB) family NADH-FMN oxidoreductase RutF